MKNQSLRWTFKIFIILLVFISYSSYSHAKEYPGYCECSDGWSGDVTVDRCDPRETAVCDTHLSYVTTTCFCVPPCNCGDGECDDFYIPFTDDGPDWCDEDTSTCPTDCCINPINPDGLDCNDDSICEILDKNTDPNNCGSCGNRCSGQCINGQCSTPLNSCDNDVWEEYEQCDPSVPFFLSCTDYSPKYSGGNVLCYPADDDADRGCTYDTSKCSYCGDGRSTIGEVCDINDTITIKEPCVVDGVPGVEVCDACTDTICEVVGVCGDGRCNILENESDCFIDCSEGWSTTSMNFNLTTDRNLNFSGASGTIISDGLDLLAGRTYIFNADFIGPGSITITLNSDCISNNTFTQINCGINRVLYTGAGNRHVSNTITLARSSHLINNLYYKNVSITIAFTGNSILRDASLKEDVLSSGVYYNGSQSDGYSTYGCCPIDYCWDGVECANSANWMNNASYPPVWNDVIYRNWSLGHINISSTYLAKGYRCIKQNRSSDAPAEWVLSTIKYDWNFTRSGYCAKDTDCYVGPTSNRDYSESTSASCVSSGEFVTDKYVVNNGGNHYCYQGNWTTKSYFIATLLQNISENSPYILHCYDNGSVLYNNANNTYGGNIISACVMARPFNLNDDTIITGIVLDNDTHYGLFVADLFDAYFNQYGNGDLADPLCTLNTSQKIPGGNFSTCIVSADNPGLYAYYESNYKYLIVSNKAVTGIVRPTLWTRIKNFFIGLFRSSEFTPIPYTKLEYATSYDKVYIMRTEDANVTALEEYTYDELLGKPTTLFYITYQGSNQDNNPINALQVFNIANSTRIRTRLLYGNYSYNAANVTQELVIQTDNKTGIWKYFTATLRFAIDVPPTPAPPPP